jgi:hypothetical protein
LHGRIVFFCEIFGDFLNRRRTITALQYFDSDRVGLEHAFRSSVGEPETGQPEGTAVTTSLRFTGKTRYNTFIGVEAEMGSMLGRAGSNVAGAYGVAGLRNDLGALRLAAELVAGRRWIRYDLDGGTDPTRMVAEPRVRADLWLAPQVTLGGAVGATLGDDAVWMAGIYVGLHSQPYAATR